MKIVPMSAELIAYTVGAREDCKTMEQVIERAGRVCYKSEDAITADSAKKFIKKLLSNGHMSVVEHCSVTNHIIADRGWCYSGDTDVLTSEGWKPWPDICGDELFATLNPKREIEYHRASEIIVEDWDDEMYIIQSSLINLCVTPNHRMYIQKHDTQAAKRKEEKYQLIQAREIYGKRVKYKRNAVPVKGDGKKQFTIPDFETQQMGPHGKMQAHTRTAKVYERRLFAEFLGYWISEGSLDHNKGSSYSISMFQNEGPVLDRIKEVVTLMGYPCNVKNNGEYNRAIRFCDSALYAWLKPFSGSLNKRIPRVVLDTFSAEDLKILFKAYIAGDGSVHHESGHMQGYTISSGLSDDLQELALKIGISATTWIDDRVGKEGGISGIIHRHPCYVVSFVTAKNEPLVNHGAKTFNGKPHEDWVQYEGKVYCAVVPNHTLYVRRNGRPCWSGNSHELVRHRIAAYSQESTRYVNYKDGITVIEPPDLTPLQRQFWLRACEDAEMAYRQMSEAGCKPQIARSVLPTCLKTEVVSTFNLRQWLHVLNQRMSPACHPQMRSTMFMCHDILRKLVPTIFEMEPLWVIRNTPSPTPVVKKE